MKKSIYYSFLCCALCIGLASSCSNPTKATEPEVTEMNTLQDSLKQTEEELNQSIENLQKSMKAVDEQFEFKN